MAHSASHSAALSIAREACLEEWRLDNIFFNLLEELRDFPGRQEERQDLPAGRNLSAAHRALFSRY